MAISIDIWYVADTIRHQRNEILLGLSTDQYGMVDNLSAYIEVYDTSTVTPTRLATLNPHYDENGETLVNLSSIIDQRRSIPKLVDVASSYNLSISSAPIRSLMVKCADQHGLPAVPEALTDSDEIKIVDGFITPLYPDVHIVPNVYVMHAPYNFIKPVHPDQQDWIYAHRLDDQISSEWKISALYDDDSVVDTIIAWPGFDTILINCGPANLVQAHGLSLDGLVMYTVYIDDVLIQQYQLTDPCHPYNFVILVDNGRGGMESLYLSGKKQFSNAVTKEKTQLYSIGDTNLLRGDVGEIVRSEYQSIKVFTGYHDEGYTRHLRHIIARQAWLIDATIPGELIKLVKKSTSYNFFNEDDDLHGFEIDFEIAINEHRLS